MTNNIEPYPRAYGMGEQTLLDISDETFESLLRNVQRYNKEHVGYEGYVYQYENSYHRVQIARLERRVRTLEQQLIELREMCYAPGGPGMKHAKKHFEALCGSSKSIKS